MKTVQILGIKCTISETSHIKTLEQLRDLDKSSHDAGVNLLEEVVHPDLVEYLSNDRFMVNLEPPKTNQSTDNKNNQGLFWSALIGLAITLGFIFLPFISF